MRVSELAVELTMSCVRGALDCPEVMSTLASPRGVVTYGPTMSAEEVETWPFSLRAWGRAALLEQRPGVTSRVHVEHCAPVVVYCQPAATRAPDTI